MSDSLPKSEVLARYVFVKRDRGTLIRKFLTWKTNKKDVDDSYPGYVVFITDYSSGRKSPLDRKVKITDSEDQMWEIFDSAVKKGVLNKKQNTFLKGWSLFASKDARSTPLVIPNK